MLIIFPSSDKAHFHLCVRREEGGQWVPVTLGLGLPLSPDKLCIAVCGRASASNFLDVCTLPAPIAGFSS